MKKKDKKEKMEKDLKTQESKVKQQTEGSEARGGAKVMKRPGTFVRQRRTKKIRLYDVDGSLIVTTKTGHVRCYLLAKVGSQ